VASTISFNLALGVSLSEATDAVRQEMARIGVPSRARQLRGQRQSLPGLAQKPAAADPGRHRGGVSDPRHPLREPDHPITILSTLPSAGVGAILALLLSRPSSA
jgi:multidrug efflux pump